MIKQLFSQVVYGAPGRIRTYFTPKQNQVVNTSVVRNRKHRWRAYSVTTSRCQAFFLLIALSFPFPTIAAEKSDYRFYFFGIDTEVIRQADWKQAALGAASALAVHWIGHVGYAKLSGNDVTWTTFTESMQGGSPAEKRNFARAGFVAQSIVGLALTSFEGSRRWDFTRGFVAMAAVETLSYPLRIVDEGDGDIELMNKYGANGDAEWGLYSAISLHNLFRVPFVKD